MIDLSQKRTAGRFLRLRRGFGVASVATAESRVRTPRRSRMDQVTDGSAADS
jgi:hypothetical protein